ncbi:MAG: hypothetical protein ACTHXA_02445 [Gulosibacter sp.]|uniref:hypothetical protein n=1 Tax=Gulosibacter sp. TaxID=2817531 RepID=UPI003F932EFC
MNIGNLLGAAVGLVVCVAFIGAVIWLVVRQSRRARTQFGELDPEFVGWPIGQGVVVELTYLNIQINERLKYRIAYRIRAQDGSEFFGWEVKFLGRMIDRPRFKPGTMHLIAYRPGVSDEVRAVPPSYNPHPQ